MGREGTRAAVGTCDWTEDETKSGLAAAVRRGGAKGVGGRSAWISGSVLGREGG